MRNLFEALPTRYMRHLVYLLWHCRYSTQTSAELTPLGEADLNNKNTNLYLHPSPLPSRAKLRETPQTEQIRYSVSGRILSALVTVSALCWCLFSLKLLHIKTSTFKSDLQQAQRVTTVRAGFYIKAWTWFQVIQFDFPLATPKHFC